MVRYSRPREPYLSGEVCSSALGHLENDRRLLVPRSFKRCNNGGGRRDILDFGQSAASHGRMDREAHNGGDGELLLLGIIEELPQATVSTSAL